MNNVFMAGLALAGLLLTACRSTKPISSNLAPNSADNSSSQTANTQQPNPEPQWAQVAPNLALMGTARKGLDLSNSTPEKPRFTYLVDVRLKNTGAATISFDTAMLAFEPGKGEPLRQRVTSHPINKQGTADDSRVLTRSVKKNEEEHWEADSNGYTYDLLSKAAGEPVLFSIVLQVKGKTIAGPFRATLPDLNALPAPAVSPGAQAGKQQAPVVNLKFQ